ncbi:hypothetical protein [Methylopila sp. 73B]|uniref:hypothetical protein n=1 Tax=Methylopila sp. 73B TaxID=1120792 RepID=UPI0003711A7E|nr:hypothetical protein [Methylopila sp. 73B]
MTARRKTPAEARAAAEAIKAHRGRWTRKGQKPDALPIRVMDIVEGYVVARCKGAAPFLTHVTDWPKQFEPIGEGEGVQP